MIYLDNNTFQQEIFIPRSSVKNDASPEYATKNELENAIENEVIRADEKYAAKTDLLPYATTGWVESQDFATKEWTDGQIQSAITSETERTEETYQKKSEMVIYSTTNEVENMINNAVSGKMDTSAMSAYTKTENFATINGSAITEGGNIVIEGGGSDYSAGSNINIDENNVISVTGITVPTSNTAFTNDAGYVTSGEVESQITGKNYPTKNWVQDNVALAIESETARTESTYAKIGDIPSLDGYATTEWVNNQGFLKEHQDISGKLDSNIFTAYTANTKTELDNKQDISGMTEYATTAFTENTYAKTGDIPTNTSDLINDSGYITDAALSGYATEQYVDNSVSGKLDSNVFTTYTANTKTEIDSKQDISGMTEYATTAFTESTYLKEHQSLSAYTPTSGFSTINGSAITSGDNLVIEETPYSGGTNIDITDHIISVTGITIPTSNTAFTNDAGYITTADTQNFVTSGDVQTQINDSISGKADSSAVTAQISEVKAQIEAEIPSKVSDLQNDLNFASTGDVESMISGFMTSADVKTQIEGYNYINSGQAQTQIDNSISGKLDSNLFTTYTSSTQTELDNKQDISGMTEYATTAFTESTYLKEHQSLSAYSTTEQVQTLINTAKQEVENEIPDVSDFVTSAQVNTQIESKGYITGYTETDPVFMASPASGITANDITNWNGKQPSGDYALRSELPTVPTSNTAFTNDAGYITDAALNGYATTAFTEQTYLKEHQSLSAYTPTSGFSTINGSAITEGGNIEIQGSSGGTNVIELTQAEYDALTAYTEDAIYVITDAQEINIDNYATKEYVDNSISGKVDNSALTQYYTSAQTDTAISNAVSGKLDTSAITAYSTTEEVENMITAATYGLASEEWVNNQGFLKEHQDISGKLDTSVFTAYTANTQTEIDNKQDASAMTAYATTAFTESTYLKEHQSLSAYSTTEQMNQAIGSATAATTGWVESQGFLTEHQSLSAYTPTSGFSTINGSAITSGGNIVVEETPYSAGTNIDITDHIISVTGISVPTKLSELTNDEGFVTSGEVETQITSKGYITGYTETDPVFQASAASGITSQDISNWNNKLDSSALTPYYTSAQTDTAISNAISGKMDTSAMSAYTKTEGFATINGSAITEGGNIVIQGGSSIENYQPLQVEFDPSYSFIDAYEINSVGKQQFYKRIAFDTINGNSIIHQSDNDKVNWAIPTSTSALTNDSGYVTSGEVNTQIESKGYITDAALNGYATTAFTEQTYLKEHQSLSAYTPTSGFSTINGRSITEGGNIVIQGGGSGSDYIAGANIEITADNVINVTGITVPTKLSELTNDAGYITTETDPVFMASPVSGITEQDITKWNSKIDASSLDQYYTSAQTDTAIDNAVSGKQDTLVSGTNIKTINGQSIVGNGDMYIPMGMHYQAGTGLNLINGFIFEVKDYNSLKQGTRLGEIEKVISIALNDLNNRLKNLK